jgi:hypothetical protein
MINQFIPTASIYPSLSFDNTKWNYDSSNDVYWRVQIPYCSRPQAPDIESMGIFVPGAYMTGSINSDGTYSCVINMSGKSGGFYAASAPIVVPVNTPGYSAASAPLEFNYDSVAPYLAAGFVYLQPGLRGRSNMMGSAENRSYSGGAPWGITDLKAAIRYYRYNASILPGNADNIYTFGMSGGGAQSALAGTAGDSPLYTPYLEAIGAAMTGKDGKKISDAVTGSMCWCPVTSLDEADEAYEWDMGQFSSSDKRPKSSFCSALSKDLASSYADYINRLKLKNNGEELTLTKSDTGVYQSGTYYDYILSIVQNSLNNFLADNTFPYIESQAAQYPGGPPTRLGTRSSVTYETVQDYIDSFNTNGQCIIYDAATNTAKITDLGNFSVNCKLPIKGLGAFDGLDRGQGENNLFGNGQGKNWHFDPILCELLKSKESEYASYNDWQSSYAEEFTSDLALKDDIGTDIQTRVNMYNPMYFLCDYYEGFGTSTVAKHWRIRTGIFQQDTSTTVEANLALALENTPSVKDVDFETVWGVYHILAERTGDCTANFIAWVNDCATQQ